jgi:hypothetical protein
VSGSDAKGSPRKPIGSCEPFIASSTGLSVGFGANDLGARKSRRRSQRSISVGTYRLAMSTWQPTKREISGDRSERLSKPFLMLTEPVPRDLNAAPGSWLLELGKSTLRSPSSPSLQSAHLRNETPALGTNHHSGPLWNGSGWPVSSSVFSPLRISLQPPPAPPVSLSPRSTPAHNGAPVTS